MKAEVGPQGDNQRYCPDCGGIHYGSIACPLLPEEMEKNKKAAEEGFWRTRRESQVDAVTSGGTVDG